MLLGYCQIAVTLILGFKFTQAKRDKCRAEILQYREAYRIHMRALEIFYFLPFPHLLLKCSGFLFLVDFFFFWWGGGFFC